MAGAGQRTPSGDGRRLAFRSAGAPHSSVASGAEAICRVPCHTWRVAAADTKATGSRWHRDPQRRRGTGAAIGDATGLRRPTEHGALAAKWAGPDIEGSLSPLARVHGWPQTPIMKLGALWAGLKHDLRVLSDREQQQEGLISAWNPTLPKGVSS